MGRSEGDIKAVRLPSWREVFDAGTPWGLHLRAGGTGVWLMRGEADDARVDCRFLAGSAARTLADALEELGRALELEEPLAGWDALADAVPEAEALALLVTDAERVLEDDPAQLTGLLGALRAAAARVRLRVIFQARELTPELRTSFGEFGVAEIV